MVTTKEELYVPTSKEDKPVEMTVVKRISFDAAHYLPGYEGKCAQMHGHHWVVELGVKGPINEETGIVVDFVHLSDFLKEYVVDKFDHTLLNDIIPNPTAENLARYILMYTIRLEVKTGCKLAFIKCWETEDSYALLEG